MTTSKPFAGAPMLQGARDRRPEHIRYHLTRASGQMLHASALPIALASAALVIAGHVAIAAMTGWAEAQSSVLNPQPRRQERQP